MSDDRPLTHALRTIQKRLRHTTGRMNDDQKITRIFTKLMFQGKIRAAMHFLSVEGKGTSLPLDSILTSTDHESSVTVLNELDKKHPLGQPVHSSIILDACDSDIHLVLFECIDGVAICKAAICTNSC